MMIFAIFSWDSGAPKNMMFPRSFPRWATAAASHAELTEPQSISEPKWRAEHVPFDGWKLRGVGIDVPFFFGFWTSPGNICWNSPVVGGFVKHWDINPNPWLNSSMLWNLVKFSGNLMKLAGKRDGNCYAKSALTFDAKQVWKNGWKWWFFSCSLQLENRLGTLW